MRFGTWSHPHLCGTFAIALLIAGCQSPKTQASAPPEGSDINWLFVLSATGGSFDGETLTLRDVPPALMFSDRPYRIWGHMDTEKLLQVGSEGSNSFAEDPPNAVLSTFVEGQRPSEATVVLHRPTLDGGDVSFPVDVLEGDIPAAFGPASLFIDHWHRHPPIGALVVGAAIGHAVSRPKTETVVVKEPAYYYQSTPVTVPPPTTTEARLAEAKDMYDKKLITKDEYEKKRAEILKDM
jgi:hypothetical protein